MIRIAVDIRPLQFEAYRNRGIGRFLTSLLRALQRIETNMQFLLVYSPDHFSSFGLPERANFSLLPLRLPFHVPKMPYTSFHADPDLEFQFDSAMECFLVEHKVDLFHNTFPFGWEFFVPRRLHTVPFVATVLDVIPLIYRQEYLDPLGYNFKVSFADRLGVTVYAQRVQTISMAAAQDIVNLTGISPKKIDIIYPGVDEEFHPLDSKETEKELHRLGIEGQYIFAVLGFHYTKNLQRTVQSFAYLPEFVRNAFHLIVLCPLSPDQRRILNSWITTWGLADRVRFLERVSQRALVALYSGARAVLHTTLYEGFGLPVLEALACGAPVVASDIPVLREVAADAAIYVDPTDPAAIATGVLRVLEDSQLQERLRAEGLRRARLFSWKSAALKLLQSYQTALSAFKPERTQMMVGNFRVPGRRLRIAFWSPLNPKQTGISDYSEALIAAMRQYADIDCYVEGYQPSNRPLADTVPIYDARAYVQINARKPYDMNLYQIGNNALHVYIYRQAMQTPGIVTLHDVILYYLVYHALVRNGCTRSFWEEVAYSEGKAVAERARRDYLQGRVYDYELALNRRIVERSLGIIVHSQWAAERVAQIATSPVQVIPMGCTLFPPDDGRFARVGRTLLGWPVNALIIGVFGIMHRVKRLESVVRVYKRLREQFREKVALVLMGPVDPTVWPLIHALQQEPARTRAEGIYLYPGYVPTELMLVSMLSVDVGVNLRNPTAGETSAILHTMLAMGRPVIVSDIGAYREYPDRCCPKIPIDEKEEPVLYRTLLQFVMSPTELKMASESAWAYSQSNTWDQTAQRYLAFVETLLSRHGKQHESL